MRGEGWRRGRGRGRVARWVSGAPSISQSKRGLGATSDEKALRVESVKKPRPRQ